MENRAIRILAIVPSGFCFGLQNLTLAFFSRVARVTDCHFLNTRWNDGEFPRRLAELGIPHSATWLGMFSRRLDWVNLKMTLECLLKLPIAYWNFLQLYWRFRPSVIYLANHHEIILFWPLLLFLRNKVVCHMHDPPPAIPFQKLSFFFWRRAVGRFLFISENVRERLALLGPLHERDLVIHNGVEFHELELPWKRDKRFCAQFGWPESSIIVAITGQMSPHKGHEDFLAAAGLLKDQPVQLRYVIAGKQQQPFLSRLKSLVQELGLESLVGFAGWLPQSRNFFEGIDIFVLASRHDEGFGLVVAEAGERGLPVVCTRSGGAVEVVLDGETGILVDKNRPQQIAAAIAKLSNDSKLRAEQGQAGRRRVRQDFNLERQAKRFVELLAANR